MSGHDSHNNHDSAPGRRGVLRAGIGTLAALTKVSGLSSLFVGRAASAARGDPLGILCSRWAGSVPDRVARAVADQLLFMPGQHALVDNRPGAAGQHIAYSGGPPAVWRCWAGCCAAK